MPDKLFKTFSVFFQPFQQFLLLFLSNLLRGRGNLISVGNVIMLHRFPILKIIISAQVKQMLSVLFPREAAVHQICNAASSRVFGRRLTCAIG